MERLEQAARTRWSQILNEPVQDFTAGTPRNTTESEVGDLVRLLPIASGKGGVGKTNIAVSLAVSVGLHFARKQKRVLLIDGDIGLPNADLVLGVRPDRSLASLVERNPVVIEDLVVPTRYPGLDFVAGAEEASLLLGNLYYQQRKRIMGQVGRLRSSLVIFDLGASASKEVLDFFAMSNAGLIVINPEPASLRDAYVFLKNAILRRVRQELEMRKVSRSLFDSLVNENRGNWQFIDRTLHAPGEVLDNSKRETADVWDETRKSYCPLLVVNRAMSFREGRDTAAHFQKTVNRHLGISCRYLGTVLKDEAVEKAVRLQRPFRITHPKSPASQCVDEIARKLLNENESPLEHNFTKWGRFFINRFLGATT